MTRPHRSPLGRLGQALLVSLLLPAATVAGQQTTAPAGEPILIELQLGRLVSRTVPAWRMGETALVPLGAFFELAELRVIRDTAGVVQTLLQPGNIPFALDPASRTLRLGKEKRRLTQTDVVQGKDEVFLSTEILGEALQLEWAVSWPDLQIAVIDPDKLPIARRIRRESYMRSRLAQSETPAYSALRLGLERRQVNGLIFDYSLLSQTGSPVDGGAYSTSLGLDVFGGSFGFGLQSQDGAGRAPRADVSWTGIWRESQYLTQLQLGDGISTGPRSRTVRGISLSNSPYLRPAYQGNVPFGGQLGPGWTVEAYRGGRLVGFDSVNALGSFSFDVPVQYGENPVDFVAYGPFGELREFSRTYRVRTEGLQARHFEYGLAAGGCRTTRCSASGNLDLRYGIDTRWTLRAGVDQFWRDSLGNLSHPYVGMLGSIGNAVTVEGEAVGDAVLRGVLRYEPSVNLQLLAEANRFARGVKDPILTPDGRLNQWTLAAFVRPLSRLGATYLDASVDRIENGGSAITSGRFGGSVQLEEVRFLPAVRFQREASLGSVRTETFYGVNTFVLPHPGLGKVLGSLSARTTVEFQRGVGTSSASAFVGFPIIRGLRSETGATWFRGSRGAAFSILVAAELPSVRSYTTVTAGAGQPAAGSQFVQGSAIYNPARGSVDFSHGPALQRGGVTGRVFLDGNGNGKFDRGEQPLAGVRVVVGPVFALSDSNGAYRVWDLLPFEPTAVTVDSSTLASPLWVPAFGAAAVEPAPNRYRRLDVPVLPGGVVEGRVRWLDSPVGATDSVPTADSGTTEVNRAIGGVTLVLSHKASGDRRIMSTFSDGSFYVMGLRPGEWEITVDPKCKELLHAHAEPVRFSMKANLEGDSVTGLEVELK